MELDNKNTRKILFIVACSIVIYLFLENITGIINTIGTVISYLTPFIIGVVLAYILNVPLKPLERLFSRSGSKLVHRIKRPISVLLSFIILLAIFFLVFILLIPQLVQAFTILYNAIPIFFRRFPLWVREWIDNYPEIEEWFNALQIDWSNISNNIINFIKTGSSTLVDSTLSVLKSAFGTTFNILVGLIFSIYALLNKDRLKSQARRLAYAFLPEPKADRVLEVAVLSNKIFSNFVTGQLTEALILGSLCFIGMVIFRFPFAPMTSVLVGVTALIPIFGAFIGTAVGAFMILMVNPIKAFWFIVYIIVLQQIEGNVIYPRVVGTSVGLPAMWVMLAVSLGGSMLGIFGMILFVPLFAVLYTLLRDSVSLRLKNKNIQSRKLNGKIEVSGTGSVKSASKRNRPMQHRKGKG